MDTPRRLVLAAVLLLAGAAIGLSVERIASAPAAQASATRHYTLRMGSVMAIPDIGQTCALSNEGGAAELHCARSRHPRHQVTFFRNRILVWKVGNPDSPVWSGTP